MKKLFSIVLSVNGRSASHTELVYSETRVVSDTETLTYSEYSDGMVLLTDYTFSYTNTVNSLETNSFAYLYDVTIKATCTGVNGLFKLSNVKYSLINGDYDIITSTGSASVTGACTIHTVYTAILQESASQNANIKYQLDFQIGPTAYYSFTSTLTLAVGNNQANVTHIRIL